MTAIFHTKSASPRRLCASRGVGRLLVAALCIMPAMSCSDPIAVDDLSDFMILAPGDYFFIAPLTIRPASASTDSVVFRWEAAWGAERYTIVFAQAHSRDSLNNYRADFSTPAFTIPVNQPKAITIPYGVPNPLLDAVPVAQYPALEHVVRLSDLDAALASHPKGVPLYFVWSIQAHRGSRTRRSIEVHRLIIMRS